VATLYREWLTDREPRDFVLIRPLTVTPPHCRQRPAQASVKLQ